MVKNIVINYEQSDTEKVRIMFIIVVKGNTNCSASEYFELSLYFSTVRRYNLGWQIRIFSGNI